MLCNATMGAFSVTAASGNLILEDGLVYLTCLDTKLIASTIDQTDPELYFLNLCMQL